MCVRACACVYTCSVQCVYTFDIHKRCVYTQVPYMHINHSCAGLTALMKAASGGHTHVCMALTALGADVNARGHGGMTALMFAVCMCIAHTNLSYSVTVCTHVHVICVRVCIHAYICLQCQCVKVCKCIAHMNLSIQ